MTFEKVEINTWKPLEANDEIVGIFVKQEHNVGANNSMLYHMEVEGKPMAVWGSAVLDTKMNAVKPGDLIKIQYLGKGEAKGGKNAPKLYDVYIDYEHREKNVVQVQVTETQIPEVAPATPVAEAVATPAPAQVVSNQ